MGIERGRSLLLHAEMKLPGTAQLEFRLDLSEDGTSTQLTMTARFRPRGLFGIMYWYSVMPLHSIVFGGMLKGIKRAAESSGNDPPTHTTDNQAAGCPAYGAKPIRPDQTNVRGGLE